MIDTPEYQTVVRAAEFLDQHESFPDDWRDRIDLDTLDLCVNCIVDQALSVDSDDDTWWGVSCEFGALCRQSGYVGSTAAFACRSFEPAWKAYLTATRGQANTETSSDLGESKTTNNPTSPPTTCGQTRTRSPEVLERVTANV